MSDPLDVLQGLYKAPYCKALALTCQQYHGYENPDVIEANCLQTVSSYELSVFKVTLDSKGVGIRLFDDLLGKGETAKRCDQHNKPPKADPLPAPSRAKKAPDRKLQRAAMEAEPAWVVGGMAVLAFAAYVASTLIGGFVPEPVASSILGGQTYQGISPDGNYL